ncbi:MAG: Hint domain-containing protein [Paracoccaceae bacterium]
MASYVLNATTFGVFNQNLSSTGDDDDIVVNIGPGFWGVVTVNSIAGDGEIEEITVNIPPGWSLVLTGDTVIPGETPAYHSMSYNVVNASGTVVGIALFRGNIFHIPCFTSGAGVLCAGSKIRLIEDLRAGDKVMTRDRGLRPIKWIGSTILDRYALDNKPEYHPISFKKNALGNNKAMLLSPQHRVLLTDWRAELLFGEPEVLVPAKALLNDNTITIKRNINKVEYFHILFEKHEILFVDNIWSESFFPGAYMLNGLGKATYAEITALFPALETQPETYGPTARMALTPRETRLLSVDA